LSELAVQFDRSAARPLGIRPADRGAAFLKIGEVGFPSASATRQSCRLVRRGGDLPDAILLADAAIAR